MKTISKTMTLAILLLATMVIGCKNEDGDAISPSKLMEGVIYVTLQDSSSTVGVVDLGLSTSSTRKLWAICNIGASTPEGLGTTFAWGETNARDKDRYDRDSYSWYINGEQENISKYNTDRNWGHKDSLSVLEPCDDPATVLYGEKWKTPSKRDYQELLKHCTRTWGTVNGVWGCMLTSTENGNSIFFPLTGVVDTKHNSTVTNLTNYGFYWTRELNTSRPNEANTLWIKIEGDISDITPIATMDRERGLKVRAIISRADAIQ